MTLRETARALKLCTCGMCYEHCMFYGRNEYPICKQELVDHAIFLINELHIAGDLIKELQEHIDEIERTDEVEE